MDEVRFYFSFRSPYSWLAFHRTPPVLAELPVSLKCIPVFPPPGFPNDPTAVPAKLEYLVKYDIPRLAAAYDLPLAPLAQKDIEWIRPHAMWIYADDHGKGDAFGKGVYAARFSQGKDLGEATLYADIATAVGLDPDATVAAGDDTKYQERVMLGMMGALQDGLFGVPFFVYRGDRFFGHDRLPWLVRAIRTQHGLPVDDRMLWL